MLSNERYIKSIDDHINTFYETISEYEPKMLYSHWRSIVRSIDEMINIPMELDDHSELECFLNLNFSFNDNNNVAQLKKVLLILENRFEKKVAIRFQQLAIMCSAINEAYKYSGVFLQQGSQLNLSDTQNTIAYLQSRRAYFITTLNLIPKIAQGNKVIIPYIDTLNLLLYPMDSCLVNITTAYYALLLNNCLPELDGEVTTSKFYYNHLEGFFMEPERLSLLDQNEFRPNSIIQKKMLPKADNKLFSFSEIANTMTLFESVFDQYKIQDSIVFKNLSLLFYEIAIYLQDDFHIVIEESKFLEISRKYTSLTLYLASSDYFENLNSFAPFQKIDGLYYTTVVLLTKFIYRTLTLYLSKDKKFQINSGFIFEDKVAKLLEAKGFKLTNITRINRKEFDLITIKNCKIFNFQCKNNHIDISTVNYDYKKISRLNQKLCRYYMKALAKEEERQNLIASKTNISDIEHFIISRYPVITTNKKIINLIDLEDWQI